MAAGLGAPERAAITGVVLAGGRGSRMGGVDKGWVVHDGRPLVEHVIARLQPQVEEIILNANRNLERYRGLGYRVVPDDDVPLGEFAGPLAGMAAGLRQARHSWICFVPCDAPALAPDLVARLAHASAGRFPAMAMHGGRAQPVFCLLPRSAEPALAAALRAGERMPRAFLEGLGAVPVEFEDPEGFDNINAPEQVKSSGEGRAKIG